MEPDYIAKDILTWYKRHARHLPWRQSLLGSEITSEFFSNASSQNLPSSHKSSDHINPYKTWLSEIMLQQTTVATVIDYFNRFTNQWPTIFDLNQASEDQILSAWSGLGYYSRARNLKKCANIIVSDYNGKFPNDEASLLKLPGVGPYTAAAIVAIAFNQKATPVDGNIERVIARLFNITEGLPAAKTVIKKHAIEITPSHQCSHYVQAMMDLGASICTPRSPQCHSCPIASHCLGLKCHGAGVSQLPQKAPKAMRKKFKGWVVFITNTQGNFLMKPRENRGLLAKMHCLPGSEWAEKDFTQLEFPTDFSNDLKLDPAQFELIEGSVQHQFTHIDLEIKCYKTQSQNNIAIPKEYYWCSLEDTQDIPLPTLTKKLLSFITAAHN